MISAAIFVVDGLVDQSNGGCGGSSESKLSNKSVVVIVVFEKYIRTGILAKKRDKSDQKCAVSTESER